MNDDYNKKEKGLFQYKEQSLISGASMKQTYAACVSNSFSIACFNVSFGKAPTAILG